MKSKGFLSLTFLIPTLATSGHKLIIQEYTNMFQSLKEYFDKQHKLTNEEWNIFKEHLAIQRLNKKTIITHEGQIEKFLFFIAKGGVRKYYLKNGKEYSIDFRFENQLVSSYTSFLTQTPSRQFVETLEETTLYKIGFEALMTMFDFSIAGAKLGRLNAEELFIEKEFREASLMLDNPDERYLNLLKNKKKWLQRVPQHYIASFLNMTPETLSRVRKRIKT